jgi:putative addiction module CopG family antidote
MPTRNVNLTEELDRFVSAKIKSGRYENASEVVRAALRTLEREEQEYEAKLAALRAAIDEGDASGIAEGKPFDRVREALRPSNKKRRTVPRLLLSLQAEADLMDMATYALEAWGADQAIRYIDDLERTCKRLAENPQLGRPCEHIRPGLRRMESGRHVIFYRVDQAGVFVSRVLHQRMLPERQNNFD